MFFFKFMVLFWRNFDAAKRHDFLKEFCESFKNTVRYGFLGAPGTAQTSPNPDVREPNLEERTRLWPGLGLGTWSAILGFPWESDFPRVSQSPPIGVISLRKGEAKVIPVRVTPSGKGLSTPHPRGGGVPLRLSDIRDFWWFFRDIRDFSVF